MAMAFKVLPDASMTKPQMFPHAPQLKRSVGATPGQPEIELPACVPVLVALPVDEEPPLAPAPVPVPAPASPKPLLLTTVHPPIAQARPQPNAQSAPRWKGDRRVKRARFIRESPQGFARTRFRSRSSTSPAPIGAAGRTLRALREVA